MAIDTKISPSVILGLDAGDAVLIERWALEGYLPTIASIMKRGCWGRTTGPELISKHGLWISTFSGISRSQHGYYNSRQLKPGTYDLQTVTGRFAKAFPFWSYLRERDKKIAIIDVPDIYPLPGLNGIQLSDWATHNSSTKPSAEPASILKDVRKIFGPRMMTDEKQHRSFYKDRKIHRYLLDRIRKKGELCCHLLKRDDFDLIVIVFSEPHAAGHRFWKYRPEALGNNGAEEGKELTNGIRDVYQAIDHQIGLLLAQLPEASNVFIVSSTGIQDGYPTSGFIEDFCNKLGYQARRERSSFSIKPMSILHRVVPQTWQMAFSRCLPKTTRERLVAAQFRDGTNWRKTVAFPIPSFFTSLIRINLRGREPEGIIQPGAEYEALLDQLEDDLKQLIHPNTGETVVERVARSTQLFGGDPPSTLPDLFVEWKAYSRFINRLIHPKAELVQNTPTFIRGSHHTSYGFLAIAGPSISELGAIDDVSPLDLAPTFFPC